MEAVQTKRYHCSEVALRCQSSGCTLLCQRQQRGPATQAELQSGFTPQVDCGKCESMNKGINGIKEGATGKHIVCGGTSWTNRWTNWWMIIRQTIADMRYKYITGIVGRRALPWQEAVTLGNRMSLRGTYEIKVEEFMMCGMESKLRIGFVDPRRRCGVPYSSRIAHRGCHRLEGGYELGDTAR